MLHRARDFCASSLSRLTGASASEPFTAAHTASDSPAFAATGCTSEAAALESWYHIEPDDFVVLRYSPEDFLVHFRYQEAMLDVLHAPTLANTPFFLVWRRWRRESMASTGSFRFKVLIAMKGIPAHLWGIPVAERILGYSCAKVG